MKQYKIQQEVGRVNPLTANVCTCRSCSP